MKTDSEGNEEWNQTFGDSDDNRAESMQHTMDGGYIIAGATISYGTGVDFWLLKVEGPINCTADDGTEGVELWEECYSIQNTTELDLPNNQLTGAIPPEIGNLTNLESLILFNNQLTGSIPSEIGNLTNLESLILYNNQLTGEIPSEIGNLTNLSHLSFNDNQLTGSIPSEIGNMTNLKWLVLGENQLTGEIPSEIGNLTNLEWLYLGSNQLTGSIPSEIGNLTNLASLESFNNQLTGSIPSEIGNLTNLIILDLGSNQLTGSIPLEIGNLTNLESLILFNNQLTGEIPDSICDLNISWDGWDFNISNNQLCPPYPSCIEDYVGEQNTTDCEQVSIIDETLPITYNLHNAYPNPFNPITTLQYDIPENANVNITIYDMMGRQVKTLVNGSQTAGYHSIQWNATNDRNEPVSAGVYLYSIEAGEFVQTKKMVLLK